MTSLSSACHPAVISFGYAGGVMHTKEAKMRGLILWLLGVPLSIVLLLKLVGVI